MKKYDLQKFELSKTTNANNIAIAKNVVPKFLPKLDKHLACFLSGIWQPMVKECALHSNDSPNTWVSA